MIIIPYDSDFAKNIKAAFAKFENDYFEFEYDGIKHSIKFNNAQIVIVSDNDSINMIKQIIQSTDFNNTYNTPLYFNTQSNGVLVDVDPIENNIIPRKFIGGVETNTETQTNIEPIKGKGKGRGKGRGRNNNEAAGEVAVEVVEDGAVVEMTPAFVWSFVDMFESFILNNNLVNPPLTFADYYANAKKENEATRDKNKYFEFYKKNFVYNTNYVNTIVVDARNLFKNNFYFSSENHVFVNEHLNTKHLNIELLHDRALYNRFPSESKVGRPVKFKPEDEKNKYTTVISDKLFDETHYHYNDVNENNVIPTYSIIPKKQKNAENVPHLFTNVCSYCNMFIYDIVAYIEYYNNSYDRTQCKYQPVCLNCCTVAFADYYIIKKFDMNLEDTKKMCDINDWSYDNISIIDNIKKFMGLKLKFTDKIYKFVGNKMDYRAGKKIAHTYEGTMGQIIKYIADDDNITREHYNKVAETFEFESKDSTIYATGFKFIYNSIVNNKNFIDEIKTKYPGGILLCNFKLPDMMKDASF